jgi:hypothetical protein
VLNFPSFALCLANFGIAGARPRWSAVLAWEPADLARSSSLEYVPVSPLPLRKLSNALARLKSIPVAGMAHQSCSGPPEAFSPPFSPLCLWIHGPFPAIEFVVVPSSSLPNFDDPGTPLAHACLNSSDITAAERSSAARSRSPLSGLIPSVRS